MKWNPITWPIPERVRTRVTDAIIDALAEKAHGLPKAPRVIEMLQLLRSDGSFQKNLTTALKKASENLRAANPDADPELLDRFATDTSFFLSPNFRAALVTYLKNPDVLFDSEKELLVKNFMSVFPADTNHQIARQLIASYLQQLAKVIRHLPEFQQVFTLDFQQILIRQGEENLDLARSQLQLTSEVKSLLEYLPTLPRPKQLPKPESHANHLIGEKTSTPPVSEAKHSVAEGGDNIVFSVKSENSWRSVLEWGSSLGSSGKFESGVKNAYDEA